MAVRRNVLIFHSGALGDFILSWPLALAFGRLFAQSRIFYVATKGKGLLAERALKIESIDAESGWHDLFADKPNLSPACLKLLEGAHAIASFVADDHGTWVRNVRALSPYAELTTITAHPPEGFSGHHAEFLVQQLQSAVVWQQGVIQMLSSLNQRGLGLTGTPGGPILIHPGAGSPAKCWPITHYIDLARRLTASGKKVVWVVGEAELERWPAEQLAALRAAGDLQCPETNVKLYDLLAGASGFVGNDSGPGHLSGIMGIPTLTLYGPTDPAVWHPIGPRVTMLRESKLNDISVDQVELAIRTAWRL